jgi:hypothetical protein
MKPLTEQIVKQILTSEKAWDKKTRELIYEYVITEYHKARERMWLDQVYFPRLERAVKLAEAWKIYPEDHYEDFQVEPGRTIRSLSCEECLLDLQDRLETYFERLWWSDTWAFENPSYTDILALNVKPKMFAPKKNQPALF